MQTTRIQNQSAADAAATRTGRASASPELDRLSQAGVERVSAGGSDQIQLSSLTGRIVELAGMQAAARTARVEELSKLYAGGHYSVNPAQLSQRVVNEWLANGTASGSR